VKQKQMDFIIAGIVEVSRAEIAKALAPLNLKIAELTAENAALKDAVRDLRQKQVELSITPQDMAARYRALAN
jgi:cell division protein FtsB